MELLACAVGFLSGLILAPLLTAGIVRILGKDRFAGLEMLEGCATALLTAAAAAVTAAVVETSSGQGSTGMAPEGDVAIAVMKAIAISLAVSVLCNLWWLYCAASWARGRQFAVDKGTIRRLPDRAPLAPRWVHWQELGIYSDPLHQSILYALTLHDEQGELARNGYSCKQSFRADLDAVMASSECCAIDLEFVWRERPYEWLKARMDSRWASVLWPARENDDVSENVSLAIWKRFLMPKIEPNARIEIDRERFAAMVAALPPLPDPIPRDRERRAREQSPDLAAACDARRRAYETELQTLLKLLPSDATIEVMTSTRFETEWKVLGRHREPQYGDHPLRFRLASRG